MIRLPTEALDALRAYYAGRACCVTGGAGFIGGHLVDALLSLDAAVTVIDDLSSGSLSHLAPHLDLEPERARFVHGSILDPRSLADALAGASAVFHLAAICSVPRSIEQPDRTWAVNATGTLRVLHAAQAAGVRRFVLSASSSAYGNAAELPVRESMPPAPVSPYAASKLAAEHLVSAYAESFGLSGVSLRYFNVFGPRQAANTPYAGVIPAFASAVLAGRPPVIFGDGTQSRDFTYVGNVVFANLLAAASGATAAGAVLNIGTGERTRVLDLAHAVLKGLDAPADLRPEFRPARRGDVLHSLADISLAARTIGYRPVTPLNAGLEATLDWYRASAAAAAR